jgi:hypothetical protein
VTPRARRRRIEDPSVQGGALVLLAAILLAGLLLTAVLEM